MTKPGRNDFCPCGSGKKYKKCCEIKEKNRKFSATQISPSKGLTSFFHSHAIPKPPAPPQEEPPKEH